MHHFSPDELKKKSEQKREEGPEIDSNRRSFPKAYLETFFLADCSGEYNLRVTCEFTKPPAFLCLCENQLKLQPLKKIRIIKAHLSLNPKPLLQETPKKAHRPSHPQQRFIETSRVQQRRQLQGLEEFRWHPRRAEQKRGVSLEKK